VDERGQGARMRVLAILSLHSEGAFLPEWLAHQRACRFTDFLICSSDDTDRILDRPPRTG
jgi:hypothetical protein